MSTKNKLLALLPLLAVPLLAQPQIGGGTCSSATLSGTYSLTLTARDAASAVTLSAVELGVGTATFDGLSKVTLALTENTFKSTAVAATLSGTYSMQANCVGTVTITSGDSASFTLESYNQGKSFLLTGEDSLYSFNASGTALPTTACTASQLSGTYSFNGNGFTLASGALSGVVDLSGLLTFDGTSVIKSNGYYSAGGSTQNVTAAGTYTVNSNCTGTATLTDSNNNTLSIQFTITSSTGANFIFSGASPQMIFTASGRTL